MTLLGTPGASRSSPTGRRIDARYLGVASILFLVEVAIATWATGFVRHSVGDVLAIVLVYALLRGAPGMGPRPAAVLSFVAGVAAEGLQLLRLADLLGLSPGSVGYVVIGSTASWLDLVMYAIGAVLAYGIDRLVHRVAGNTG